MNKHMRRIAVTACSTIAAVAGLSVAGESTAGQLTFTQGRTGAVVLGVEANCFTTAANRRVSQSNPIVHAPADGPAWVTFRPIVYSNKTGKWQLDTPNRSWSQPRLARSGAPAVWPGFSTVIWPNDLSAISMGYEVLFSPGGVPTGGVPATNDRQPKDARQRHSLPEVVPGISADTRRAVGAGEALAVQTAYLRIDQTGRRLPGIGAACTQSSPGYIPPRETGVLPPTGGYWGTGGTSDPEWREPGIQCAPGREMPGRC